MALLKGKYYDIKPLLDNKCEWNLVIGERSSGKTYSTLKYLLHDAWTKDREFAIIRRYEEDFKGRRGSAIFSALEQNNEISKLTKGEWTGIRYYSKRFYWCKYNADGKCISSEKPIGYCFSLASSEHDKSTSYNSVYNICFDEFIASGGAYLVNEFVLLCNVISTIARDRMCCIIMLGNTISKSCPYWNEMHIDIQKAKQGSINIFEYENGMRLALEMTDSTEREKESDKLFSFGNSKLNMIKGAEGDNAIWQFDCYPHLPSETTYKPKDILYTFFIEYSGLNKLYQCELVCTELNDTFIFIHEKTTPLKDPLHDLIFTDNINSKLNYRYGMMANTLNIEKVISRFFRENRVYYQDNEVGDAITAFRKLTV